MAMFGIPGALLFRDGTGALLRGGSLSPVDPPDGGGQDNSGLPEVPPTAYFPSTTLWGNNDKVAGPYVGTVANNNNEMSATAFKATGCTAIGSGLLGKMIQGVYSPTGGNGFGTYNYTAYVNQMNSYGGAAGNPTAGLSFHVFAWLNSLDERVPWEENYTGSAADPDNVQYWLNNIRVNAEAIDAQVVQPLLRDSEGRMRLVRLDVCNEPIRSGGNRAIYFMNEQSRYEKEGSPVNPNNPNWSRTSYWKLADADPAWTEGTENCYHPAFREAKRLGWPREICYVCQFGMIIIHAPFGEDASGVAAIFPVDMPAASKNSKETGAVGELSIFYGFEDFIERTAYDSGSNDGHIGGAGFQGHMQSDMPMCEQMLEWQFATVMRLGVDISFTETSGGAQRPYWTGTEWKSYVASNLAANQDRGTARVDPAEDARWSAKYLYSVYKRFWSLSNAREMCAWNASANKVTDNTPISLGGVVTLHTSALRKAVNEAMAPKDRNLRPRKVWFCIAPTGNAPLPLGMEPTGDIARETARNGWDVGNGGIGMDWPRRRVTMFDLLEDFPSTAFSFQGMFRSKTAVIGDFLVVRDSGGNLCFKLGLDGSSVVTLTVSTAGGNVTQLLGVTGASDNNKMKAFALKKDGNVWTFTMAVGPAGSPASPASLTATLNRTPARIYWGGDNGSGGDMIVHTLCQYDDRYIPANVEDDCVFWRYKPITRAEIDAADITTGGHPDAQAVIQL